LTKETLKREGEESSRVLEPADTSFDFLAQVEPGKTGKRKASQHSQFSGGSKASAGNTVPAS
jgi:hypothetical protein